MASARSIREKIRTIINDMISAGQEWNRNYPSAMIEKYLKPFPFALSQMIE